MSANHKAAHPAAFTNLVLPIELMIWVMRWALSGSVIFGAESIVPFTPFAWDIVVDNISIVYHVE